MVGESYSKKTFQSWILFLEGKLQIVLKPDLLQGKNKRKMFNPMDEYSWDPMTNNQLVIKLRVFVYSSANQSLRTLYSSEILLIFLRNTAPTVELLPEVVDVLEGSRMNGNGVEKVYDMIMRLFGQNDGGRSSLAKCYGRLSLHLPRLPCVALPCLVLHLAFPGLSLHLHLTLPRLTLYLASPRPPPFTLASPSSFALHPLLLSSSSLTFASSSKNNSFRYSTTPSTFAAPAPHRSFAHGRCAYAAYLVVLAPPGAESHGAYAAQLTASPLPTLIVLVSPTHPCRSCLAPSLLAESCGLVSCYMSLDPGEENRACQESCIFDASLVILAAEILCSCIWQPFLESTKEKLSKFCHVPSKRSCFLKLDAIKNAIAAYRPRKKPVTLSWEDNNCFTMEISGLEIGWGQANRRVNRRKINIATVRATVMLTVAKLARDGQLYDDWLTVAILTLRQF
ncbi:hypothetical protein Fmac_018326 [Flemingia macrophylla]|uniref:Uncharacterized protein n=1 Tax=Flemingia macrophylla TaxID=520843 RepID=A0ABD1M4N8_9FABA